MTRWQTDWGRTTHYTVSAAGSNHTYVVQPSLHPPHRLIPSKAASSDELTPSTANNEVVGDDKLNADLVWDSHRHQQLGRFCSCPAFSHSILSASVDTDATAIRDERRPEPLMVSSDVTATSLGERVC